MHFFLQSILIFIELYSWCLIAWVILGYLPLFGVPFSLPILDRIVSPPLDFIRKTVPTSFSWIDFSPLVVFLLLELSKRLIISLPVL